MNNNIYSLVHLDDLIKNNLINENKYSSYFLEIRIIDKKNGCPEGYTHLQRLKIPPLLVSCDKKKITKIKNTDYITSTICYICNVEKTIILPPNSIPHICSCVSKTIKCNNASISKEILKIVL